jgi:RND family efflux transporter MFP subunit
MKNKITLFAVALLISVTACNKGQQTEAEQLAALKKERAELEGKITDLEKKLQASGQGTQPQQVATPVAVTPVQAQDFAHFLEVQGRVDFDQNVLVSAKVPGILTSVRVERGDRVNKGQILATIDAAILEQNVQELRTNLELARTVFEKQQRLWDQKIGTEIQYLTAKNNKEALERRLATLRQQQDQYLIKAPISGIVDEFIPKVGEAVNPGSPLPIARIVNLSGKKVIAEISEAYAAKVKKGDKAIVYLPDTKVEIPATVRVVSQAINATSRSFSIELSLTGKNNAEVALRPNMIAVVKIKDYEKENATVVPVNLVQKDETASFVYVAEPNGKEAVVRKKPVTTGLTYNGQVEVLSGLAVNDKVISKGYQSLNEGQPVTF